MTRFGRFMAGLVLVGSTVGAGLGVVVLGVSPAGAATAFTVTDANDGAGPFDCSTPSGDCSLRAAITAANAVAGDSVITLPDASTVAFNPSGGHIYQVLDPNGSLVLNDSGHTITINGAGQTLAILQMQNEGAVTHRVLAVDTGTTAVISGVRVEDGAVTGSRRRRHPQRRDAQPVRLGRHQQLGRLRWRCLPRGGRVDPDQRDRRQQHLRWRHGRRLRRRTAPT